MLRIGILETGHNSEQLAGRFGRFVDNFQRWLSVQNAEFPVQLTAYRVEDGELPARVDECDAYIITGSAAAVYEDHPWLPAARVFVQALMAARIKLLGVCFGHQLIVDVLGGRVEKSDRGWGVGRHTYDVTQTVPCMAPALPSFSLLACHQDQVVELPPGAQVLASSEFCEYAMLRIGDHVLTVQAHPEFSAEYAQSLYQLRRDRFGNEVTEQGLSTVSESTDADAFACWVLRFFNEPSRENDERSHRIEQ